MAASHLVTYDLIKRKDYPELTKELEKFAYWHCLGSVWIVKSDLSTAQIRDRLLPHIDSDDKLIVLKLTGEAAWTTSFSRDCQDWLRNNL